MADDASASTTLEETYEYRLQVRIVYKLDGPGEWKTEPNAPACILIRSIAHHMLRRARETEQNWDENYTRRKQPRPFRREYRVVRVPTSAFEADEETSSDT